MKVIRLCCLLVVLFCVSIAQANEESAPKGNTGYDPVLKKIEAYIHSIDTMKARFAQTAQVYADDLKGTFYLDRPGKLRFEYDDPIKNYIVADGIFIYFYDDEMKSASQAFIGDTLAAFLVKEDFSLLDPSIEVMDVAHDKKENLLGITLRQTENPEAGRLTLIFQEKPSLSLLKWQVVDAQGYVTQIELSDIERGVSFEGEKKGLFTHVDPKILNTG